MIRFPGRDESGDIPRRLSARVSIIIPCRNEVSTMGGLLRSLVEDTPDDCEIIVADGCSDDGTREVVAALVAEHPRIRLIDNRGLTAAAGLNRAIGVATGQYIIRLDAHTRYARDYVATSLRVLEETGAAKVGGPQLAEGFHYIQRAVAVAAHSPLAVGGSRIHDPAFEGPTDCVIYGCWRREIFDQVGLFDEELARNEDGEHDRRIGDHGGMVWQSPAIRSWYQPRQRLRDVFRQYSQYGYYKALEFRKFRRVRSLRHLAPGALVLVWMVLLAASPVVAEARLALTGLVLAYLGFIGLATTQVCAREKAWGVAPVVPLAMMAMQLGYGVGFLRGGWELGILSRPVNTTFQLLTR